MLLKSGHVEESCEDGSNMVHRLIFMKYVLTVRTFLARFLLAI